MIEKTYTNEVFELFSQVINKLYKLTDINFSVEKNKNINNGDFFTNVAMVIVKNVKKNPQVIANEIKEFLINQNQNLIFNIKIAGPGFLNFDIHKNYKKYFLDLTLNEKQKIGQFKQKDLFYNIEFVSANPTGLLHIGHARNAALGQTLANLWNKFGIKVEKEYYINDAGNQIDILATSTFIRYLQLFKINVSLPEDSYHGHEIVNLAEEIKKKYGNKFLNVKFENNTVSDKKVLDFFKEFALSKMLEFIKKDLDLLRVNFDIFFSEQTLYKEKVIDKVISKLSKYVFKKDDAIWLKTTQFGDDKDRVLIKKDGNYTYFLPDIAYHEIKLSRNKKITKIFNIWGADHKSYVDRMTIAIECLGIPKDKIHVIIMQMVSLTKDGKEFKMSKRTGNSLTLRDLVEAIGADSSRWALVSQTADTQIEIDVNKFKLKTHDNNLYYVLYAYARINQLFKKINFNVNKITDFNLDLLNLNKERELINYLISYPTLIETIAKTYEVNKITNFLFQVSQLFHSYYNEIKIKDETNLDLQKSRCVLLSAVMFLIHSGLNLLDIEPQEKI